MPVTLTVERGFSLSIETGSDTPRGRLMLSRITTSGGSIRPCYGDVWNDENCFAAGQLSTDLHFAVPVML